MMLAEISRAANSRATVTVDGNLLRVIRDAHSLLERSHRDRILVFESRPAADSTEFYSKALLKADLELFTDWIRQVERLSKAYDAAQQKQLIEDTL